MVSMVSPRHQLPTIHTLLWNINPYGVVIKSVFIGIESTEGRVTL